MRARGAAVIVTLGGDGTVRAAAATCGQVPLLPLSTGTNNAFPEMWEATVAGTAAALLATGLVDASVVTHRSKMLHVDAGRTREIALVDVCVSTVTHIGSKAVWQPATLREIYCTFAEPHTIGLSSIAGLLHPTRRTDPHGVAVALGDPATAGAIVSAPIAPGVVAAIGVREPRASCPPASRSASPSSAARSPSTASVRSRSDRARRSPSPSRPTAPASSTCAPPSPTPPRAGSSSARTSLHPSCRRSDEGSTVPRPR